MNFENNSRKVGIVIGNRTRTKSKKIQELVPLKTKNIKKKSKLEQLDIEKIIRI